MKTVFVFLLALVYLYPGSSAYAAPSDVSLDTSGGSYIVRNADRTYPDFFSFESWFRTETTNDTNLFSASDVIRGSNHYSVRVKDGKLSFTFMSGPRDRYLFVGGKIVKDYWHHVSISTGTSGTFGILDGNIVFSGPKVQRLPPVGSEIIFGPGVSYYGLKISGIGEVTSVNTPTPTLPKAVTRPTGLPLPTLKTVGLPAR